VGHDFDLETLSELFGAGDPLVAHDQLNGYYVESSEIVVSGGLLAAYLSAHRTMINGSALCAALAVTERD
jgi:hypothetical protein